MFYVEEDRSLIRNVFSVSSSGIQTKGYHVKQHKSQFFQDDSAELRRDQLEAIKKNINMVLNMSTERRGMDKKHRETDTKIV